MCFLLICRIQSYFLRAFSFFLAHVVLLFERSNSSLCFWDGAGISESEGWAYCQYEFFDDASGIIKGSLDEKLPIYEQDPKSKRLDSFEKRFVRD